MPLLRMFAIAAHASIATRIASTQQTRGTQKIFRWREYATGLC